MTSTRVPAHISGRRLNLMSIALIIGAFPTMMNTTIVNIALDHLHTVFHSTVADTQWVVTAYLLAYVAVIPVSGWASERFGTRRVWMFAITLFLFGSVLCALTPSLSTLVLLRILQGVGGGMVVPVTLTILSRAAGRERLGGVIAIIGFIGQLAPILGPVIGGSLLDSIGWRWLFLINIPLDVAGLILVLLLVPAGDKNPGASFDLLGLLLLTPGVVGVAFGVSRAGGAGGIGSIEAWGPLALGLVLLAFFTVHSLRSKRPALLDVRVFARRGFGLSSAITFVAGFSTFALIFLLPLFYQQVRGNSVSATGLLLIPQGLGTMLFIIVNRRLASRADTRLVIAGGVVLTTIGILPFALVGSSGADAVLLAGQFLLGFGLGAVSLPIMTLAFASLSHAETPRGSAAFNVVKQVGAPFGVTVIAVLLQGYLSRATSPSDILGAFHTTFWWVFALSAIPLVLALALPRSAVRKQNPAGAEVSAPVSDGKDGDPFRHGQHSAASREG